MDDQWITHELAVSGDHWQASQRQWLVTNGTGGYAMGTVAAVNTHRYHSLLVAATRSPIGRVSVLNQVLERLALTEPRGPKRLEFTTCLFRGDDGGEVCAPQGHMLLEQFRKGLSLAWTYRKDGVTFIRELFLHWKQPAVTLRYTIEGLDQKATLNLHPMLTLRDFHSMHHRSDAGVFTVLARGTIVNVRRRDTAVALSCDRGRFIEDADWWYNLHYPIDAERAQEDREDYYLPGRFEVPLEATASPQVITLCASLALADSDDAVFEPCATVTSRRVHLGPMLSHVCPDAPACLGPAATVEDSRQSKSLKNRPSDLRMDDRTVRMLLVAADDFVVERPFKGEVLSTILAGYPWFSDWGRDTFISLPGLLLSTGRFDEARATLRTFAGAICDGLIPNRFDDYDDQAAHYNTVDASLWFIHAAIEYVHESGDRAAWDDWLGAQVIAVIDAYVHGTHHGIGMSNDGLVTAGSPHTQLTWMDAACDGVVFTPRFGKTVEINALWYHALRATAELTADRNCDLTDHYTKLAARFRRAFAKVFWNENGGYLHDHVWTDEEGREHVDPSFRPNQIFAVAMPHSPLPRTKQQQVVKAVRQHLATPYGLRTLPPDDPNYQGGYTGSVFERDRAYHQGTVWPWLIGPYAEAILRVGQFKPKACAEARAAIDPLLCFMQESGLGQLREIHEADPPHRPVGCIAQAWSVAQVLRVLHLIRKAQSNKNHR